MPRDWHAEFGILWVALFWALGFWSPGVWGDSGGCLGSWVWELRSFTVRQELVGWRIGV